MNTARWPTGTTWLAVATFVAAVLSRVAFLDLPYSGEEQPFAMLPDVATGLGNLDRTINPPVLPALWTLLGEGVPRLHAARWLSILGFATGASALVWAAAAPARTTGEPTPPRLALPFLAVLAGAVVLSSPGFPDTAQARNYGVAFAVLAGHLALVRVQHPAHWLLLAAAPYTHYLAAPAALLATMVHTAPRRKHLLRAAAALAAWTPTLWWIFGEGSPRGAPQALTAQTMARFYTQALNVMPHTQDAPWLRSLPADVRAFGPVAWLAVCCAIGLWQAPRRRDLVLGVGLPTAVLLLAFTQRVRPPALILLLPALSMAWSTMLHHRTLRWMLAPYLLLVLQAGWGDRQHALGHHAITLQELATGVAAAPFPVQRIDTGHPRELRRLLFHDDPQTTRERWNPGDCKPIAGTPICAAPQPAEGTLYLRRRDPSSRWTPPCTPVLQRGPWALFPCEDAAGLQGL